MSLRPQSEEVSNVLGDDDPLVIARPPGDLLVRPADQLRSFHDGDDIVTGVPELFGEPPGIHLVEEQFHRVEPKRISRWRRHEASSSSAACWLAAIRVSISSRWSA